MKCQELCLVNIIIRVIYPVKVAMGWENGNPVVTYVSQGCCFYQGDLSKMDAVIKAINCYPIYFRCEVEGCESGFISLPRLERHMKRHTKGEPLIHCLNIVHEN